MRRDNEFLVSIISKITLVLLSFVNTIVINRYLGAELRGDYAFILNISNIITIIIGFNIASSYPFFSRKTGSNLIRNYINILFVQISIYAIAILVIYCFFDNKLLVSVIIISIIIQFSNQLDFLSIILNVNKRNRIVIIASIINTISLIYLSFSFESKVQYVLFVLLAYNILKIFLFLISNKLIPGKNTFKLSTKEVLKFSFFPMIISLFTIFNYNIDVVILKLFVGSKEVGIYSVGVTLASMLWIIPDAFKDVLFNRTAKSDSIYLVKLSIKINIYICIVVILFFFLIGQLFIDFIYGVQYSSSYNVSLILLIGTIPMIFFKMINTLYQSIGAQKFSFYILLISVILNVILNVILIPYMGILGAAISSVISYLLSGIIMLASFMKRYKIRLDEIFIFQAYEKDILKNKYKNFSLNRR
ncbi:oligosaccharide flippase family protein [Bacillus sp. SB49]|uniref:oligosaccharide flippase family protein n=1 Tax=Bacillus sp. SB49 TaxID=1071080 RepID=UPI00040119FF|nr:polysaccharide biosynthesis C-terminal domain-containing protein [Bacillus sp. SB49]QHT48021.1 oligosaccharide flippase family protein [Bacillus sp. SB49]